MYQVYGIPIQPCCIHLKQMSLCIVMSFPTWKLAVTWLLGKAWNIPRTCVAAKRNKKKRCTLSSLGCDLGWDLGCDLIDLGLGCGLGWALGCRGSSAGSTGSASGPQLSQVSSSQVSVVVAPSPSTPSTPSVSASVASANFRRLVFAAFTGCADRTGRARGGGSVGSVGPSPGPWVCRGPGLTNRKTTKTYKNSLHDCQKLSFILIPYLPYLPYFIRYLIQYLSISVCTCADAATGSWRKFSKLEFARGNKDAPKKAFGGAPRTCS